MREVHDGRYQRNVGTDGGKTLTWEGRLVVIGACTTAWDRAHAVISVMGNRFVLVRIDSENDEAREEFGLQSIANLGYEVTMRKELAAAAAGVIAVSGEPPQLTGAESLVLVRAANLATKARTAVEVDFRGDVEDSHAPEVPTRFAKQLAQVVRGAIALGIDRPRSLKLAIRCARDSIPPMRLAILNDLADGMPSTAVEVAKRIDKPRTSVDRQLQALHALGLASVKPGTSPWDYSLNAGVDPKVLDPKSAPEMLVTAHKHTEESHEGDGPYRPPSTNISGGTSRGLSATAATAATPQVNDLFSVADNADVSTTGATSRVNSAESPYLNGLCRDCGVNLYSAGRPRCDECHATHVRAMAGYDR